MNESGNHSVSEQIDLLKSGDPAAPQRIWERYFERLIALANSKLKHSPRRYLNEEDVVQIAFENFFRAVKEGRFPKLEDRNDLWQILAMLVDRKAKDQIRILNRLKSGGGRVHGDSINQQSDIDAVLTQAASLEPDVDVAVQLAETIERKLHDLPDPISRQVVLLKMESYTNREIAEKVGIGLRTVERKLEMIRAEWGGSSGV